MENIIARGGELARDLRERQVRAVAQRLRTAFGDRAVEVEQERVLVRGKGITKRWLIDPSLRFLAGALK